ncbi:MAG: GGDEF domain-containing protein [Methylophilales bacterium]|nr:GGDEF domain-containing protein [Methylophilales bacterium]
MNMPSILTADCAANLEAQPQCSEILELLRSPNLGVLFQPIISMHTAEIIGYEGLIRGPSSSLLHAPPTLFKMARACGVVDEMEYLCRKTLLEAFSKMGGQGKLFLNVSPDVLLRHVIHSDVTIQEIRHLGLEPQQIIIEITENAPTVDYQQLREAVIHYRGLGFEIAIDDLGEGFSGLRLWSELHPGYVKIDMHFIQGINLDPIKLQFVRSIQEIARKAGALVIAEGIENEGELIAVRDIGIAFGQGYHIAKPNPYLSWAIPPEVHTVLAENSILKQARKSTVTVEKLVQEVAFVTPDHINDEVYERFEENPALNSIPVVLNGHPIGLIGRHNMVDRFARPYRRELYGKRSCQLFMDTSPLVVDKSVGLHELSELILQSEPHHLSIGFVITDSGKYLGMASGHDLLRLVTRMQIDAARYANPLTLLPGNVPLNEHIDNLLDNSLPFVACYFDLDNFKAFNDVYGYQKGDEVIQMTGNLLKNMCDPEFDFLGHIGGDDFILLFQNTDWESRCQQLLEKFGEVAPLLYHQEDREQGGIHIENRQGEKVFHPIVSLSIGAVTVEAGRFHSYHEVSAVAAVAKKLAKKMPGNSLFIERRSPETVAASAAIVLTDN